VALVTGWGKCKPAQQSARAALMKRTLALVSLSVALVACADPTAVDYVLTSSDISAINARMAQMNAHMEAKE
jgi:hypothetical protein